MIEQQLIEVWSVDDSSAGQISLSQMGGMLVLCQPIVKREVKDGRQMLTPLFKLMAKLLNKLGKSGIVQSSTSVSCV